MSELTVVTDYNQEWPRLFEREAHRLRNALGSRARQIEHTGSTSVPGLASRPIIDIILTVDDAADEQAYRPAIEAAGYRYDHHEPRWNERRLFTSADGATHLHVFTSGSREVQQQIMLRDWLRENEDDRLLYERLEREHQRPAPGQPGAHADAPGVDEIILRAEAASRPGRSRSSS